MKTQPVLEGLFDDRYLGSRLYIPGRLLYYEVCQVLSPFKETSLEEVPVELLYKVAQTFLIIILIPSAPIIATVGLTYNFFASVLCPLESKEDIKITALLQQLSKFYESYGRIFENLQKEICGESGKALEKRFLDLRKEIEPLKNHPRMQHGATEFAEVMKQFLQLRETRVELLFKPARMDNSGRIIIDDKGNCFYESIAEALPFYDCQPQNINDSASQYKPDPKDLRNRVIAWEKEHYDFNETLRGYIGAAIETYLADMDKKVTDEMASIELFEQEGMDQTANRKQVEEFEKTLLLFRDPEKRVAHYFEKAAQDGFWATTAEFYVIATMFNVRLTIRRINQEIEHEWKELFNENAPKQMTICYVDNHHFELRMQSK